MSTTQDRINIGIAREVVRRFRELYPSVDLTRHIRLWLQAEIARTEKERERAARGEAHWPELPPPAQAAGRDPSPTFAE
jgi:hypothetical protein